jgi:hypothetical protein
MPAQGRRGDRSGPWLGRHSRIVQTLSNPCSVNAGTAGATCESMNRERMEARFRGPGSNAASHLVIGASRPRDTRKARALATSGPTWEWPDTRQSEIASQGANGSSTSPSACLVSKPGRARATRDSMNRERMKTRFRGPAAGGPHVVNASAFPTPTIAPGPGQPGV